MSRIKKPVLTREGKEGRDMGEERSGEGGGHARERSSNFI